MGIVITCSNLIVTATAETQTYNSYNDRGFYNNYNKLKPGVSNKKYYINPETSSSYWDMIFNDSFYLWYLTDTPINFNRTYSYSESTIDCYTTYNTNEWNVQGWADFYLFPSQYENGYFNSWDYGKVTLNRPFLQDTTYEDDTKVTMHELGHVFGLYHVKNVYDLMYESAIGHKTSRPSSNDINRINILY